MNQQQKIELLRKYADKIRANYDFYINLNSASVEL